jgi:hypothetical protein
MSINTLPEVKKFTSELDKMYVQKAATGFFADNVLRSKFVGAKTVVIPDLDFYGLVDYDRDNGFNRAAMTVAHQPFTMQKDRARSIQIDREDLDETGIANLAGQVLGEYVRTQVVPETDAYVLSKLAGVANEKNQLVTWAAATPFKVFSELVASVQDAAGFDEELVCFVDKVAYTALMSSAEFTKMITVSDFKQGEIHLKVKNIDGVAIIPVSSSRMKTLYNFVADDDTGKSGGFEVAEDAKAIHMLVLPKKAASLVKKTEKMRVFTPEQNLDADAYKFDYRIYYDVFVKKSGMNSIWASVE